MILNKGNTCYLGSALQCIIQTDSLDRFVRLGIRQTKEAILFYQVHNHVRAGKVCDPGELYKKIRMFYKPFDNMEQNDAHEAILVVIAYLHKFMTPILDTRYVGTREGCRSWGKRYSVMNEIYKIQFEKRIICRKCRHTIINYECTTGLYETFTGLGEHTLPGYRCDRCHQTDTCSEYVSVSHYPETLIIRTHPVVKTNLVLGNSAISHLAINQTKFVLGNSAYTTFAVCRYLAKNKDSGHYNIGYLKGDTWFLVDDHIVTSTNVDEIFCNASVLFLQMDTI